MDLIEAEKFLGYRHPWELARRDVVLDLVKKSVNKDSATILDVGAGDCFIASTLVSEGYKNLTAVDSEYTESNKPQAEIKTATSLDQVRNNEFSLVLALDVVEHVYDDVKFIKDLASKLCKGGKLIVTVPAFQFLFSRHDKYLKHFRRYQVSDLFAKLTDQGLNVKVCHYFFLSLFLVRVLQKWTHHQDFSETDSGQWKGVGGWGHKENSFVTRIISFVLYCDYKVASFLSMLGVRIPGLSVCVVAQIE